MRCALLAPPLAAALLAAGCARAAPRAEVPGPVVLVSIDTLRADRLPAYGYAHGATPHVDALRRDAVLHAAVFSHCPLTLPSHASMLTGLLPAAHGVRNNLGYRLDTSLHATLPGLLRARGYATGAAVSAYVLRGASGLREPFDFYDEPAAGGSSALGEAQRAGAETVSRALGWVESVRARPFFLFVHLYEPHAPHEGGYDAEVMRADAAVGELVAGLRRLGLYDAALLVLTSDHGEGLGDHGEDEHGILLYRETLQVPLLIKLPHGQRKGETLRRTAGLVDLLPTVGARLGLALPEAVRGRDLLHDGAASAVAAETYYPRIHLGWSELRSLRDERYYYVAGPRPELYDWARDPGETTDVAGSAPAVARAMQAALDAQAAGFTPPSRATAEERERLQALGYLAGGVEAPPGGDLPNPRDRIHLRARLKEALAFTREGRDARAVEALRALLAEEPRLFDAQVELAAALARLGRVDEALAAYAAAARTSPSMAGSLAVSTARLHLERGDPARARAHAEQALASDPGPAHEVLARAALATGDLPRADSEARAAAADPALALPAAVVLAEVRSRRGDAAGGLALLDEARARHAGAAVPSVQFVRGDLLARLGRHAEAEAAFRAEIAAFPGNARAYASLAIVSALQGRPLAESRALLETMQRARPGNETALLAAKTLDFIGDAPGAAGWRRRAGALEGAR
jgi:arylsulfatase A-like enzyme/Flp pilus assembly protein TadD